MDANEKEFRAWFVNRVQRYDSEMLETLHEDEITKAFMAGKLVIVRGVDAGHGKRFPAVTVRQ